MPAVAMGVLQRDFACKSDGFIVGAGSRPLVPRSVWTSNWFWSLTADFDLAHGGRFLLVGGHGIDAEVNVLSLPLPPLHEP
ncbi:MAG TPA: hypothetical protein VH061_03845 [Solirubrobacteraceae bacterium]|jgi:hypothetical protein|nr:hypothetical protein [Solirubrobacteraceae bacterium]